jgi:hypothetical protein
MATSQRLEQIASVLAGPVGSTCTLALYDHDRDLQYEATLVRQLFNTASADGNEATPGDHRAHSKPRENDRIHSSFLGVLLGALYALVHAVTSTE